MKKFISRFVIGAILLSALTPSSAFASRRRYYFKGNYTGTVSLTSTAQAGCPAATAQSFKVKYKIKESRNGNISVTDKVNKRSLVVSSFGDRAIGFQNTGIFVFFQNIDGNSADARIDLTDDSTNLRCVYTYEATLRRRR